MKERILTGWTIQRGLYLLMGTFIIVQAGMDGQWFGIFFGGYLAAMGLFAFGCAAGNCFTGSGIGERNEPGSDRAHDSSVVEVNTK